MPVLDVSLMLRHGLRGCEKVTEGLKMIGELGELVLNTNGICLHFLKVLDHWGQSDILWLVQQQA